MLTQFSFRSKVWRYDGKAGWYFVSLLKQHSKKIRKAHGLSEEGWGRLKASAPIGKTAVWYDIKVQKLSFAAKI